MATTITAPDAIGSITVDLQVTASGYQVLLSGLAPAGAFFAVQKSGAAVWQGTARADDSA